MVSVQFQFSLLLEPNLEAVRACRNPIPLPDAHLICTAGLLPAQNTVRRSFRLHQQLVLQARADLFTVFNHPNSEGPSTTLPRHSSANQHRCSERRSARGGSGFYQVGPCSVASGDAAYLLTRIAYSRRLVRPSCDLSFAELSGWDRKPTERHFGISIRSPRTLFRCFPRNS